MEREKPLGMRVGESAFCLLYLVFAAVASLIFAFMGSEGGDVGAYAVTCAAMTAILGAGDAFHLVPRIVINLRGAATDDAQRKRRAWWLGLGNLVSSISMTGFYLLFFRAMELMPRSSSAAEAGAPEAIFAALCVLAVVRVVLCLFPQNRWFDGGDATWAIYRNLPFCAMGLLTAIYLVSWYRAWNLSLLVCASFACYLAVVLGARKRPALGMLMIPKTICYMAIITLLLMRL